MAGLDLRGIRKVLNAWIVDGVHVTRDNGVADDELDMETGKLVTAPAREIYHGVGAVQPLGQSGAEVPGITTAVTPLDSNTTHRMLLPLETVDTPPDDQVRFRVGDRVVVDRIVANTSDPSLLGSRYLVTEVPDPASFAVVRVVFLKPEYVTEQGTPAP